MALSVARTRSGATPSGFVRPSWASAVGWLTLALLALLVAVPVVMLVLGSFSQANVPSDFSLARLTASNYVRAYTDPRTYQVLANSVVYVVCSVACGIGMSLIFTWLVARTDVPARWLWTAAIPLALVVPGMLESMSWVLLFSPKVGFVNRMLSGLFHSGPIFDVYSLLGIIALESLRTVPTTFLLLLPLMIRFDPALEEAASLSGSSPWTTVRRVTLPLLVPGLLSVVIYQAVTVLASFEVPGILGLPGQVYVFSTLIYTDTTGAAASSGGGLYGLANALAMLYLLLNVVALFVYARVTRNAAKFAIVTGKAYRPRRFSLGHWRWLAAAILAVYLFISVVLPLLVLLWVSLTSLIVQPTLPALGHLSGTNWQHLFMSPDPDFLQTLVNTVITVVGSATLAVALSLMVAWVSVRTRFSARHLVGQLAFMAHGIPGIILGLALIWFWLRVSGVPIYGTLGIVIIGLVTTALAFGSRTLGAALLQIHTELEEAAHTSGASPFTAIRRVLVPILMPALGGVWIWVALQSIRNVTLPLMLQTGSENTVLSSYLWQQWEAGNMNYVGAIGVSLIVGMLVVTLVVARLGMAPHRTHG